MSRPRSRLALPLIALLLVLQLPAPAYAWRNGGADDADGFGTHDWVLFEADRLARESGVRWLDLSVALPATDDPDSVFNDRYHHQYDVWGYNHTGDAPSWIEGLYLLAARQKAAGDIAGASRSVGLLAHYFADVCNPLHTDDDDAEGAVHGPFEYDVQRLTDETGESRDWVVPDGVRPESEPASRAVAAATAAHGHYRALLEGYTARGLDPAVAAIARGSLDTAVNGLADIIAGIDAARVPVACERVAGGTRYETAVAVARRSFPCGARAVVVATGEQWPDALAGAPLAAALDAPLLLVRRGSIPSSVSAELRRLSPEAIVVLGGPAAVSTGVARALADVAPVERIGGADRYATARLIAERVRSRTPAWTGEVLVATGADFPDAVAASPVAASRRMPVLLTRRDSLPAETAEALASIEASRAYVLGSERAVGPAVAAALDRACLSAHVRLAGSDRYETAAAVARYARSSWGASAHHPGLAAGSGFPDALTGGVALGRTGDVLLLTPPAALAPATAAFLVSERASIAGITVFGGESVVGPGVAGAALAAIAGSTGGGGNGW